MLIDIFIAKKLNKIKLLFLFIECIFISTSAYSQPLLIGKIQDSETNENVVYAYVTINDSLHFITNDNGIFMSIIDIDGSVKIQVNMLGYKQYIQQINFPFSDTLFLKISPAPFLLDDVVVEKKRQKTYKAKEIVEIAIDSLYRKSLKNANETSIEGLYNQVHYSMPVLGFSRLGKFNFNPRLDTVKRYEFLMQAHIITKDRKTISIKKLRRSYDNRKYYHGYTSGKGKSVRIDYVKNNTQEEKRKAIKREKELYTLRSFFNIDPIGNFKEKVNEERSFYLSSGTYAYLNGEFIRTHSLKLEGIIDYDNHKVAKIKILPSPKSYKHGFLKKHHWVPVGYIYIRMKDFGILKMEYSYILNPKKTNFAAWATAIEVGVPILFKDIILYKEIDGQLELAYLNRFQRDIDVDKDNDDDLDENRYYYMEREFFASKYSSKNAVYGTINSVYDNYVYDEDFWINSNLKIIDSKAYKKMVSDLGKRAKIPLNQQFINNNNN